ncbi:MAG: hypothetical protein ACO3XO_06245 [Bdellovibrionota bacterium]
MVDEKDPENRGANDKHNGHIEESEVGEVKIDSALMHEIEEEGRHTSSIRPFPGHVSERIQRAVSLALNLIPENNKRVLKKTFSFSPLVDFLTSHSSSNHRPWVALAAYEEDKNESHSRHASRNGVPDSEDDVDVAGCNTNALNGDRSQNYNRDESGVENRAVEATIAENSGPVFRFTPSGARSLDAVSPEELNEALRALRGYQKPVAKGASKKK